MTACFAPAGYYPAGGFRQLDGLLGAVGSSSVVWASAASLDRPNEAWALVVSASQVAPRDNAADWSRVYPMSVRCLQAFTSDLVSHMLAFPFAMFVIPKRSEGSSLYDKRKIPHFVSG